jgi:hypothetical protein
VVSVIISFLAVLMRNLRWAFKGQRCANL